MNKLSKQGFQHHVDNIAHQSYIKACWREHGDIVEACDISIEFSRNVLDKFYDRNEETE